MVSNALHWENVYQTKSYKTVGWYQETAEIPVGLLLKAGAKPSDSVVDVGCGASVLVDTLIEKGFDKITLLDLSKKALSQIRDRLGDKAEIPYYMASDITKINFHNAAEFWPYEVWPFDIWHDRAVFHFLTTLQDRQNYMSLLARSLTKNGRAIISTFRVGGATSCSGLDVIPYNEEKMILELPDSLEMDSSETSVHMKPDGTKQDYIHFIIRRKNENNHDQDIAE